jgi:phage antirepressor YoqD-like protein
MEIHANKIPEEEIEDVKKVVQRVQQNKFKADLADVKYLFKVYHKYIAPHDKQFAAYFFQYLEHGTTKIKTHEKRI